jgi:YbbR domain-containing protein
MSLGELAQELARLDRVAKTAKDRLDEAKGKMMAAMDEVGVTKVPVPSGKATITLIDGERLDVDYEALEESSPETASKVRALKVDLSLWRAGITAGIINVDLAASVSKTVPYRQIKVSRK